MTKDELELRLDVQEILQTLRNEPRLAGKRLRPIDTPVGLIVVMNPSKGQAAIAMAQIHEDDKSIASKAMTGLFRTCIVYPTQAELDAKLDEMPLALTEPGTMLEFRRHIGNAREADSK